MGYITERVVEKAGESEIILMQDYFDTSMAAALRVVDKLFEEGNVLVTIEKKYEWTEVFDKRMFVW